MPTLATARGSDFVANLAGALDKGVAGFEREAAKDKAAKLESDIDLETQLLEGAIEDPETDVTRGQGKRDFQAGLIRLTRLDPQLGKAMESVLTSGNDRLMKQAAEKTRLGAARASFIKKGKTVEERRERARAVKDSMLLNKESPDDMNSILEMDDDQFDLAVESRFEKAKTATELFKDPKITKFKSDEGLIDSTGKVIREISDGEGSKVDVSKLDPSKFTGESIDIATGPGGKFSDLKFRKEFLDKLKQEGRARLGNDVVTIEKDPKTGKNTAVINQPVLGKDGKLSIKKLFLGGPLVSRARGLTPQQEADLEVETEGRLTRAKKIAELEAKGMGAVQARNITNVDAALSVADDMPELEQTLELLFKIETGGTDALSIKAMRAAGLEGGDMAELTFNLRKRVLKQLKPTFGAAFTEREGKLLADIEASEDKSTDGNIRVISRYIEKAKRVIRRGKRSAKRMKDTEALAEIEEALKPLTKLSDRPFSKRKREQKAKKGSDTGPKSLPANSTNTGKFTKDGKEIWVTPKGKKFVKN